VLRWIPKAGAPDARSPDFPRPSLSPDSLQRIAELMRDRQFAGKFVFVEDYDINVGLALQCRPNGDGLYLQGLRSRSGRTLGGDEPTAGIKSSRAIRDP